jgi:hypothetical protein
MGMSATTLTQNQAATGPGAWTKVRQTRDKRTFQVTITGTANVSIEGSNDGVNPVVLQSGISASAGYEDSAPWNYVRSNVTSIANGIVTVILGEVE